MHTCIIKMSFPINRIKHYGFQHPTDRIKKSIVPVVTARDSIKN